jgi:predicted nucleotidyltransferase
MSFFDIISAKGAYMPIIDQLKDYFKADDYSFVLLFGSYSDGREKSTSDVDVGIFYDKDIDYKDLGFHTAILETKIGKKIDMIVLNDMYKKDPLFAFEILKRHIPILINDEDSYISFKTSSQLYFLDHKPFIETN